MKLNPVALEWWLFCSAAGYAIGGSAEALAIGACFALGVSLLWDFLGK